MNFLKYEQITAWIVLFIVFVPVGFAAPVNDNLATATNISHLPYTQQQSTAEATNEPKEKSLPCSESAGKSVWYRYTPKENQQVIFDTFGSDYDTALAVWQRDDKTKLLANVACNDDNNNRQQSQVVVQLEKEVTYSISVSGYNGAMGTLVLNTKAIEALSNDDFTNALIISQIPFSHTQTTLGAMTEPAEVLSQCGLSSGSVWYRYTPTADQNVIFNTVGSSYKTVLSIWTGSDHPLTEITCNTNNALSQVNVALTTGITYYISVSVGEWVLGSGIFDEAGILVFNATLPPVNDNLANATVVTGPLPYTGSQDTNGATLETGEVVPSCVAALDSVWYRYTPSSDFANMIFSTEGSSYDTVLSIWEGSAHPLTEVACNDNLVTGIEDRPGPTTSQVMIPLRANTPYYVSIGSKPNEVGNIEAGQLVLHITEPGTTPPVEQTFPDLGVGHAVDAQGNANDDTAVVFTGGISVNNGEYQKQSELDLTDTVEIHGKITLDPQHAHIGQVVDIIVYAGYKPMPTTEVESFYMLNTTPPGQPITGISLWDAQPTNLVAFWENITLQAEQIIPMYLGHFVAPGNLWIFFGYRLRDGTDSGRVVTNSESIDVTIN